MGTVPGEVSAFQAAALNTIKRIFNKTFIRTTALKATYDIQKEFLIINCIRNSVNVKEFFVKVQIIL